MRKSKYKFNHETLSFDKITLGIREMALRLFAFFLGSLFLACIYGIVFGFIFDSPKEKDLKNEIAQISLEYEIMNKDMSNVEKVTENLQNTDDKLHSTIFGAKQTASSYRGGNISEGDRLEDLDKMSNTRLIVETTRRLNKMRRHVYMQTRSYNELVAIVKQKEFMLRSIPAIQPVENKDLKRTASGYGMKIHPIYKISRFHDGMDFTAPAGTAVFATADGVVESALSLKKDLGNNIIIDHGFGYETVYAHLDQLNVKKGQKVRRGDVIGTVGNSGLSVGTHLHYEVLVKGNEVDPALYYFNDLNPKEYDRLIELSIKSGQTFD